MRTVRRTIDFGHGLTKIINYQKKDGSILYSAFPSIIQKNRSANTSNCIDVFGTQYIVGQPLIDHGNEENVNPNLKKTPFILYYLALIKSALSRMDEGIIHELFLTAPLSRISWLSKRLPYYMNKPIRFPKQDPIYIKQLKVVPACFGSFLNYTLLQNNSRQHNPNNIMIIDAGKRLTEWLPVINLNPRLEQSGFLSLQLPEQHTDKSQIERVSSKIDLAVKRIAYALRQNQCESILLTGGGSNLFKNRLRLFLDKIPVILAPDTIYSNLLGYQRH